MTAPNPNQNPGSNGAPGPNAVPSIPNLPSWANQNTINNPTTPRSLRAELRHHEADVAPLLQELNEEEVEELDKANRLYHATYEDAYEQAYNALDDKALRADPKNKIKTSGDLIVLKRKLANKKASREALITLDEYAMDQMMPSFAGMIDQHDPRYLAIYDSIMRMGSMDEESWIGDSSIPGLRDGLWEVTQSGVDAVNNPDAVTVEPTAEELEKAQKIADLTEKLAATRESTATKLNKYAQLSGEQRNGHLGRITGTRFRDKLMRLLVSGTSTKKSEQMDANVATARNEYREAFNEEYKLLKELTEAEGLEGQELKKKLMDFQLDHQLQLETKILEEQKLRGTKSWLAERWTKSGKFGKILMVAIPAAFVGLTGGLAAAGLGLAGATGAVATGAIGVGTTYLGRKTGHGIAGKAGRDFANTDLATQWFDEKKALDAANLTAAIERAPGDELVDHTISVDAETERRVKMNRRRRERAGRLGALAAAAGFVGGRFAHSWGRTCSARCSCNLITR